MARQLRLFEIVIAMTVVIIKFDSYSYSYSHLHLAIAFAFALDRGEMSEQFVIELFVIKDMNVYINAEYYDFTADKLLQMCAF